MCICLPWFAGQLARMSFFSYHMSPEVRTQVLGVAASVFTCDSSCLSIYPYKKYRGKRFVLGKLEALG